MSKTRIACTETICNLAKNTPILYMWTFTFPQPLGFQHDDCFHVWKCFLKEVQRQGFFPGGVRVFELHKSGAVHIHALIIVRTYVRPIRAIWTRLGGGRLHVKAIPSGAAQYLAKYLNKRAMHKHTFKRGTRLWACWGTCKLFVCRCRDIEYDNLYTRCLKWAEPALRLEYYRRYGKMNPATTEETFKIYTEMFEHYLLMYLYTGQR